MNQPSADQPMTVARTEPWTTESLRREAARLQSDLVILVEAVPGKYRPISKMARWLLVDRALVHRFVSAASPLADPLDVFDRLPGLDGLKTVADAIAAKNPTREVMTSAQVVHEQYETLLGLAGGSQNKLKRRAAELRDHPSTSQPTSTIPGSPLPLSRRAIFDAAVNITGVRSGALIVKQIWRPSTRTKGKLESISMIGQHRVTRLSASPMPVLMAFSAHVSGNLADSLALDTPRTTGANPAALLTRFSSDPFPRVVTKGNAEYLRDVIDVDPETPDPFDVFIIKRDERDYGDPSYGIEVIPRIPTENLVVDLYVHRDLKPFGLATGVYFVGVAGPVRHIGPQRWYDRLDAAIPPAYDEDQVGDANAVYPRHTELRDYLLGELAWNREEFRLARWIIPCPLWSCDHAVSFKGILPEGVDAHPPADGSISR
jgi:hypothetical protein